MSLSFGSKSTDTQQKTSGERDPWSSTVPFLHQFLSKTGAVGGTGLTKDQKAAFGYLKSNAFEGNPWDVEQAKLTNDLYAAPDRTGTVGEAYGALQGQLGGYASGQYLDPMSNPQMQAMLTQVGDDAQNRINAMFAGAGRDLSGANQQAVAKGVTQAQLPLLMDQYNRAQDQQMGAAQTLFGAGQNTATTLGNLDAQRFAHRMSAGQQGIEALNMQNQGANEVLALDQQIKMMPYEDLGTLGSLLFPVAQLGGQTKGKMTGSSDTTSFGAEMDVGKAIKAIGTLSDERAKADIQEIGEMPTGEKLYRYRYKDDPTGTIHVGPMAQEVEEKNPGAVSEDPETGLKMVNMDAATRKAAEIIRQRRANRKG
jgi:hypothetical protein